jgi:transposase
MKQVDVAAVLNVSVACVNKWSQRFEREGIQGAAGQTPQWASK